MQATRLLIIFFIHIGLTYADGSVSYKNNILPIIKQNSFMANFIENTFKIEGDAEGIRLGNDVAPAVSGSRTGPYTMKAFWRSPSGDIPATLTIYTQIKFYDEKGNLLKDDITSATKIIETFDSLSLEP